MLFGLLAEIVLTTALKRAVQGSPMLLYVSCSKSVSALYLTWYKSVSNLI